MWLWEAELRERGFRRRSERYWRCEGRFGLPPSAHLSVFSWGEQAIPPGPGRRPRFLVELTEFHVTFQIALERIHFYYHEEGDNAWRPGGHTSAAEVCRLGHDVTDRRAAADAIAAALVASLHGVWLPRVERFAQI